MLDYSYDHWKTRQPAQLAPRIATRCDSCGALLLDPDYTLDLEPWGINGIGEFCGRDCAEAYVQDQDEAIFWAATEEGQ